MSVQVLLLSKYFSPYYRGGIERYVYDLAEHMDRHVGLHVVASNINRRRIEKSLFRSTRLTMLPRYGVLASTPVCPAILTFLRNQHADLIHIQSPNPLFEASILLHRLDAPLIVTHHSDVVRQVRTKRLYQKFYDRLLRRAHKIIVSSLDYANGSDVLRPHLDKVVPIPMGISPQLCGEICLQDRPEILMNVVGPERYVLGVGRLVDYKGFPYLIQAAHHHKLPTVIIGSGPKQSELRGLAYREGLGQRIHFLSDVKDEDLRRIFHHAELFVLSSITKNEAFGIVQLEAMIHGRPVVTTDIPGSGVSSVQKPGKTGLLVPPGSAEALGEAIARITSNESLRSEMGKAAREHVLQHFTTTRMAEQTWALYQACLGN